MLDIRFVRENPELVKENIRKKFQNGKLPLVDEAIALDAAKRAAESEANELRASRNALSKKIGMLMGQAKKDPSKLAEAEEVKAQVKANADRLAQLEVMEEKLSGVYAHTVDYKRSILFRGFDDKFWVPHSRNTTVAREDIEAVEGLKVLSASPEAGVYAVKSPESKQVFLMGHAEYDADTLKKEYLRDVAAGIDIQIPANYFTDDDPAQPPIVRWRSCAHLLYANWLNYCVYQTTPYDISEIKEGTRTV